MNDTCVPTRPWALSAVAALLFALLLPPGVAAATPDTAPRAGATAEYEATAQPRDVCSGAVPDAFRDVRPTDVHAANIDCVAHLRIAVGVGDGAYAPARDVSRAQMASYLVGFVRATAGPELVAAARGDAPFADVQGSVHEANIGVVARLGITSGVRPGAYEPALSVSREQMATFVAGSIEAAGGTLPAPQDGLFEDTATSVHRRSIDALAAAEVVRGYGDDTYGPRRPVSRAQMGSYLVNAARFLAGQGIEVGDGTDEGADEASADAPALLGVRRIDEDRTDLLELKWDGSVTLIGTANHFSVYDADDDLRVAGGIQASVVGDGGSTAAPGTASAGAEDSQHGRIVLHLDGELEPGERYWLRVAEDAVEGIEGVANGPSARSFLFSVAVGGDDDGDGADGDGAGGDGADADGDGADADGDGAGGDGADADGDGAGGDGADADGDGAGGDGLSGDGSTDADQDDAADGSDGSGGDTAGGDGDPLTVLSAVTDPVAGVITVRFSSPVSCPDTAAARAAWSFTNPSLVESGTAQAEGSPDHVVTVGGSTSEFCNLGYDIGIENGDFGTLAYTAPAGSADAVATSTGTMLATVSDVTVADGLMPMMLQVAGFAGSTEVAVQFSEPIACSTVMLGSLQVSVAGDLVSYGSISCSGSAQAQLVVSLASALPTGATLRVVSVDGLLRGESLENPVIAPFNEAESIVVD